MASLAQVSDVRTSQSDVTTQALARLWTSLSDAQLLDYLTQASGTVESIVGGRLVAFTTTEDLPCTLDRDLPAGSGLAFTIPVLPAWNSAAWNGTVTAVKVLDPYSSTVSFVTVAGPFDYDPSTGRVRFNASSYPDARTVRVTYTGGFTTVPPELIKATIYLAGDAFLVGTDSRNGQPDALDCYNRALTALSRWTGRLTELGFA